MKGLSELVPVCNRPLDCQFFWQLQPSLPLTDFQYVLCVPINQYVWENIQLDYEQILFLFMHICKT